MELKPIQNKRGQAAVVGLMIGVFVILFAIIMIAPISDVIDEQMNASNMDCDNASISDGAKATCLAMDLVLPYFFVVVVAVGGAYVAARFVM